MSDKPLSLFEAWGIEIEYALVDQESLDVRAVADEALRTAAGADGWVEDHDDGDVGWSNELVGHVLELKTAQPARTLDGWAERFLASARRLNALLAEGWNARLMPTGMHPWMDPTRETELWPHDHGPVYSAYDRLFDCRRHGWANVQSVHLNLPFADEHEFARLLAAVRLVLPLVPGLAAASPIVEGRATGLLDNRLSFYRTNSARVPAMAGAVIPEPIYGIDEYHERVLGAIDRELAALGADPALRGQEWTNARGAIARFDRMAIEIRLIDAQEGPRSDLAVAAAVAGVVRALVEERGAPFREQRDWSGEALVRLLTAATADGPEAELGNHGYAALFGPRAAGARTVGALWNALAEDTFAGPSELEPALAAILREGTLAQRILAALGPDFDRPRLRAVYGRLCDDLADGRVFQP